MRPSKEIATGGRLLLVVRRYPSITPRMFSASTIRCSSPSSSTSVPEYLRRTTTSPTLTSTSSCAPTATTSALWGFSLAVSGSTIPASVVCSRSTGLTITRAPKGLNLIFRPPLLRLYRAAQMYCFGSDLSTAFASPDRRRRRGIKQRGLHGVSGGAAPSVLPWTPVNVGLVVGPGAVGVGVGRVPDELGQARGKGVVVCPEALVADVHLAQAPVGVVAAVVEPLTDVSAVWPGRSPRLVPIRPPARRQPPRG